MPDPVYESLEIVAECDTDITKDVYDRYFSRCEGSWALMSHLDDIVRGKMLDEVLRLIMQPDLKDEQTYLNFEIDNHKRAYNVEPHMYGNLLTALRDAVREAVGGRWTTAMESAWRERIELLLHEIDARA